jgi:hypothetical protein
VRRGIDSADQDGGVSNGGGGGGPGSISAARKGKEKEKGIDVKSKEMGTKITIRWHGSLPGWYSQRRAGPGDAPGGDQALAFATVFSYRHYWHWEKRNGFLKSHTFVCKWYSDPDLVGIFEPFLFARLAHFIGVDLNLFDAGVLVSDFSP